ncbi:MAG TPA: FtsX-like permease family protein [Bryobacteraceae bacterium]|nr:FtsX-like permease family protein [Bryobacteraceae bacterium]
MAQPSKRVSGFELFVAARYLRARRKEAVISIITVISVAGVAAGVMALVVALAVTNGFRNTLQRNMLSAMAHIDVMSRRQSDGIEHWRELEEKISKLPHVVAVAPALYLPVFLVGPVNSKGVELKGIDVDSELNITHALRHLKSGSLERLRDENADPPGIILGSKLAADQGMLLNSRVKVVSPEGKLLLTEIIPAIKPFYISGTFESSFSDFDDGWAFTSIKAAQKALSLEDVVNQIEVNVDDLNRADVIAKQIEAAIGDKYTTTTWKELNFQLFSALNMERIVTMIVIGLILLVGALNILITLVMMVMEKYRDIAILMSMGARPSQIRRIFMFQGVLIGVVGSAIGLAIGYSLCYFAGKYQWIKLPESVYPISYLPFEARWADGIWIAAVAIAVSFLATLYPSKSATRIAPAEVLRYE